MKTEDSRKAATPFKNLFSQPAKADSPTASTEELVDIRDVVDDFFLTDQGALVAILRFTPVIQTTQVSAEQFATHFTQAIKSLPDNALIQIVQMPLPSRVDALTDRYAEQAWRWKTQKAEAEGAGKLKDRQDFRYYDSRFVAASAIGADILVIGVNAPRRESYLVITKEVNKIVGPVTDDDVRKQADLLQIQVDQTLAIFQSVGISLEQLSLEDALGVLWYAYNPDQGSSVLREKFLERYTHLIDHGTSAIPSTGGISAADLEAIRHAPKDHLKRVLAPRKAFLDHKNGDRIEFHRKTLSLYFVNDYEINIPQISRLLGQGNRFAHQLVLSYFIDSPAPDVVARQARKASTAQKALQEVTQRLGGTPSYKRSDQVGALEEARYGSETEKDVLKWLQLYLCLISDTDQVEQDRIDFEATLQAVGLRYVPADFYGLEVWKTTLPLGRRYLNYEARNVRARDLAGLNPVTALSEFDPGGQFLGYTPVSRASLMPVAIRRERGSVIRPGEAIVGAPGSGKSFTLKYWMTNWAGFGEKIFVIDPKGEFLNITQKLGGTVIELLGGGGFNLLQFDRVDARRGERRAQALTEMIWEDNLASLTSLYERLKGNNVFVTGVEHRHLMNAMTAAMKHNAMDPKDGTTWGKNKIFLADVYNALISDLFEEDPDTINVMKQILEPYATREGHYYALFNTPVSLDFSNDINTIVFGTSQFSADPKFNFLAYHFALKIAAQHAIRSFVTNQGKYTPYHIVIDEASQILVTPTIVGAMAKMMSLFQTYGISLHLAFQDMNAITHADTLSRGAVIGSGNTLSSVIPTYWLFKQEMNSARVAGEALNLNPQEVAELPQLGIGECILAFTGEKKIPIVIEVPEIFHDMFRTDPDKMQALVQEMLDDEAVSAPVAANEVEQYEEKLSGIFG